MLLLGNSKGKGRVFANTGEGALRPTIQKSGRRNQARNDSIGRHVLPEFRPVAKVLLLRRKETKPSPPNSATGDWPDARSERADQLAELVLRLLEGLKQGPPMMKERPPMGPNSGHRLKGDETKKSADSDHAITPWSFGIIQISQRPTFHCIIARPDPKN